MKEASCDGIHKRHAEVNRRRSAAGNTKPWIFSQLSDFLVPEVYTLDSFLQQGGGGDARVSLVYLFKLDGTYVASTEEILPLWIDIRLCKVRHENTCLYCLHLIQCGQLVGNRLFSELFSDFQNFFLWTVPTQVLFSLKSIIIPLEAPFLRPPLWSQI